MNLIIIGIICFAIVKCQPSRDFRGHWSSRQRRSVGGSPAQIGDHPYMVSLRHAGGHMCGGTIISRDVILTGAHCVDDPAVTLDLLSVKVGSTDVNFYGTWIPVAKVVKHERFKELPLPSGGRQVVDDVALLKLAYPIALNNVTTKMIELFGENDEVRNYKSGILAGWGYVPAIVVDKTNSTEPSKGNDTQSIKKKKIARMPAKLMHVKLDIASKEKCSELDPTADLRGQFCTFTFGKKVCSGDSGGPLIVDGRQAGIVSWANVRCSEDLNSGFFVDVAKYRKWIDEHMKTL